MERTRLIVGTGRSQYNSLTCVELSDPERRTIGGPIGMMTSELDGTRVPDAPGLRGSDRGDLWNCRPPPARPRPDRFRPALRRCSTRAPGPGLVPCRSPPPTSL